MLKWLHPNGTVVKKNPACQCRRHTFDPWVGKIPWRSKGQPTPVFLPGKSTDRGALQATVHGVAKSQTWLSDWTKVNWYTHICVCMYICTYKLYIGLDSKESACNAGDPGLIPRLGRSPGEGKGNPLQYSCLENPWTEQPDRLQSWGLKSRTQLSD